MLTPAHDPIAVGPLTITFRVTAEQSGGSVAVFEMSVPPGARVPAPHSHDGYEETLHGLDGTLVWTVAGEEVSLSDGDTLCIHRGVVHGFENRGDVEARALAVVTPGVLGPEFFEQLGDVLKGGGPPDRRAVADVMARHGLTAVARA